MKAIAIARVVLESDEDFHKRNKAYDEAYREWYELYCLGGKARRRQLVKARKKLAAMRQPLFRLLHLEFIRWAKEPKSRCRRVELETAIRTNQLPKKAVVSVNGFPLNPHYLHDGEEVKIIF